MALTDIALKALKPRDKTCTVSDDRGLYLEIFPAGGMVWRYRYRLSGKDEKLTLGKYPALPLNNARLMRDGAS
ncbi:Arm DNA-binding domain-containing protein [Paraburkholderia hayleyella]|uniref:Arm DNA-binding domain-containing protein n=1 Tax=Paraburkholderia hayleyella TaxID=2152889 RepID=UPI001FE380D9|nr:Arm DNA-binding domain-containing protein [Paraburkholderia hayleyella]